ncbi:MAG: AAA family ATPase [Chloroflexi bacterium]|nr:AAA family ATPase [Chloroflexota bacterium]
MSELIYLDGLPFQMRNGGVLKLLIEQGDVDKQRIGKIIVRNGMATVELDKGLAAQAVRKLDGTQVDTRYLRAWRQVNKHDADPHFLQLMHWLDLEADAEQDQQKATQNQVDSHLSRLVIKDETIGLGGITLVRLQPRNEQAKLPWTPLSAGSPVILREEGNNDTTWRGVVTQLRRNAIEIGMNQSPEPIGERPSFSIDLSYDQIARQRMAHALSKIMSAKGNRLAELRDILRGQNPAMFSTLALLDPDIALGLNGVQQTAVQHALAAEDVAIIHGPPGTGKTTTLIALIRAAVRQGKRILACAPSNMAVDNLCIGLLAAGESIVRLGHPARIQSQVQSHTLDAHVAQHADYKLAQKMRREAFGLQDESYKFRRARPEAGSKQALREEAKELFATARQLEAQAIEQVLDQTPILLATLTGIDSGQIGQRQFDLCVIDEAGQSTEPATWIPVTRSRRLVLAGDHQQLPPTILSRQAESSGFGISLLEQLMHRAETAVSHQLTIQYRMHTQIMDFSSTEFYDGTLIADETVATHLLTDLPGVTNDAVVETAVTFIDTAGAGYDEEQEPETNSRRNPQEAALVVSQVHALQAAGIRNIGVITPYAGQVRLLREQLVDDVEINSVDGFQGREKEAIVISLVRSNNKGEVGFLAETRRMNVALTRARRKLLVIGDSATITAHPFYARLVDYWDSIGAYQSVWELVD